MSIQQRLVEQMHVTLCNFASEDGPKFRTIRPSWVRNTLQVAHGNVPLNSWSTMRAIDTCELLLRADFGDWADITADVHDLADVNGDSLAKWLSFGMSRMALCDDAIEAAGEPAESIEAAIRGGQRLELDHILQSILRATAYAAKNIAGALEDGRVISTTALIDDRATRMYSWMLIAENNPSELLGLAMTKDVTTRTLRIWQLTEDQWLEAVNAALADIEREHDPLSEGGKL